MFGFCFGGGLAFAVAAADDPDFLVSYYGSALPNLLDAAADVRAPSLHHFGLADAYIPAETVERIERGSPPHRPRRPCSPTTAPGTPSTTRMPAFHHPKAARDAWGNTVTWLSRTAPAG